MKKYLKFASETSTLVTTFIGFILLLLLFPLLPIDGELIDVQNWYTHAEAMALLEGYGPTGRVAYIWSSLLLDTLFPVVYVTLLAGLIYRFRASESTWWLAITPVFGGFVDLLENVQICVMLLSYPNVNELQVLSSAICTSIKHWIFYLSAFLILVLMVTALGKAVKSKLSRK